MASLATLRSIPADRAATLSPELAIRRHAGLRQFQGR